MAMSSRRLCAVALVLCGMGLAAGIATVTRAGEEAVVIPAPAFDLPMAAGPLQTAVLAGGCFWGVQGVYQHVRGVRQAVSGYSGGTKATADYDMVSAGRTEHAESVEVRFDPSEVSYGEILQIYFSVVHDPTQLDRQGPDVGRHYRSNIFYADDAQKRVAEAYITQLQRARVFRRPIVTRVDALKAFYRAEDYHQDFMLKHPTHPYILIHDQPKLESLRRLFASRVLDQPVTVRGGGSPSR